MTKVAGTDLVRRDSIEELVGHRQRALDLYAQMLRTLEAARTAHKLACGGSTYITNDFLRDLQYKETPERFATDVRKGVDRDMWNAFMTNTPLGSLMDKKERQSFTDSLDKDPPEITIDTVFASLSRLAADGGMIFRRGLVEVFRSLSHEFYSHDGFKIGARMVLTGMVSYWGGGYMGMNHYREPTLRDMDRCFHVLDGKPAPDHQQGLCAELRTALRDTPKADTIETPYFRVRWFKNGNVHLWFLRDDLVEMANKLIAEHFGEVLGAGPSARNAA